MIQVKAEYPALKMIKNRAANIRKAAEVKLKTSEKGCPDPFQSISLWSESKHV